MNKKYLLLFIVFTCAFLKGKAQVNYVLNPSFEQYSRCPYEADQIQFANYWSPIDTVNHSPADSFGSSNCTPEYCNVCSVPGWTSIPNAVAFKHYPRTGNGLAQVQMFYNDIDTGTIHPYCRDYLQGRLYKKLTGGKSYCVSFYVVLADESGNAINNIGAYLDGGQIDSNGWQTCGLPHVDITL